MLTKEQATKIVETATTSKVVACVPFKGDWLLRVEHASPTEKNFDPFFLVKNDTAELQEFAIMTDGTPDEVAKAFKGGG